MSKKINKTIYFEAWNCSGWHTRYRIAHNLNIMALLLLYRSGDLDSLWLQRIIATHLQSTVVGTVHACRALRLQRTSAKRRSECWYVQKACVSSCKALVGTVNPNKNWNVPTINTSYFVNIRYAVPRVFIVCIYRQAERRTDTALRNWCESVWNLS
jgi:hypothetical protein